MMDPLILADPGLKVSEPKPSGLIIGLGNPGDAYSAHRHNIGIQVVEALARTHGLTFSRQKSMRARVASGRIGGQPVLLAKPLTFMNLSGRAAGRLCRAHEVPLGRLRLRPEGGSGGHKGMRSIIEALGTQAFPRLRVGIDRPPGGTDPADYVLQPFTEEEKSQLTEIVERAVQAIECWLAEGMILSGLLPLIEEVPAYQQLIDNLQQLMDSLEQAPSEGMSPSSQVQGLDVISPARPYLLAALYRQLGRPIVLLTARAERVTSNRMLCPTSECPGHGRP
jgi:PTH1 family peptidyl-tRNA hydrolase